MTFERPNIAKMQGYTPGEQLDGSDIIKLNTNENPFPPSPAVTAALQSTNIEDLRRYPPPTAATFRKVTSALHNCKPENLIATNGGDELLRLVLTTFVDVGEVVVTTQPSYSLYPVLADIQDSKFIQLPLQDDWSMPVNFAKELNSLNAKLCLLVNPHAPTGQLLSVQYLTQIADEFNGILLVDEAYVDFINPAIHYNSIAMAIERQNVILLRTLSKGYSLAGLRFGYGIASESIISPIQGKTRDSYNTNLIAQRLATAAIESVDYARTTWAEVRSQRAIVSTALTELGFTVASSQTNFLLCTVPASNDAYSLYEYLKNQKILVRYFDQDRLRDKLRITIGSNEENTQLIAALKGGLSTC